MKKVKLQNKFHNEKITSINSDSSKTTIQKIVQAADLADKFDVSIRTIYRDMLALSDAGVPIGAEAGTGYYLVDGYSLPPIMFTEKEANALITAAKIIDTNNDASLISDYNEVVEKVKAILNTTQKEKIRITRTKDCKSAF